MGNEWGAALGFIIAVILLSVAMLLMLDKGWLKIDPVDPWGWMSKGEFTAQMAHIAWSYGIVETAAHWLPLWIPLVCMMAFATFKEGVFDVLPKPYGEGATCFGSLIDWLFYGVGTSGSVVLVYLERMYP